MTKEQKTLSLVGLTLLIYALGIYFQPGGLFIFPYPINPFIFLAVSLQYTFWKGVKWLRYSFINFIGLLGVLSTQVLWEILLNEQQLGIFLQNPWIDWFLLLFYFGIMVWLIIQMIQTIRIPIAVILSGISIFGIVVGMIDTNIKWITLAYFIGLIASRFDRRSKEYSPYWSLLILLSLTEIVTLR